MKFNKVTKILVTTLFIVLVLFSSIPVGASVYVGNVSDQILQASPRDVDVIRSALSFTVQWNIRSTNDGTFFQNHSLYSTHSQYLMPGVITQNSSGQPTFNWDHADSSYWDFVNGQQKYGASWSGSSVTNVAPNGFITVPRSIIYDEGVERLACFEFKEDGYIVTNYLPTDIELDADEFYLHTDLLSVFNSGYGGFTMRNIRSSYIDGTSVTVSYSFLISDDSAAPQHYSGTYNVALSGSDLRISVLDPSVYTLIRNNVTPGYVKFSDFQLTVRMTENNSPPNYIGNGQSFTIYTHYPIVYGNGGGNQTQTDYGNVNALSELYLNNVYDSYPEDKDAILNAYNNGYKVGEDVGRKKGFDAGLSEGLAASYDDLDMVGWLGAAVGGFLDFQLFEIGGANVTLGGILAVVISLTFVMLFLKFFAGG